MVGIRFGFFFLHICAMDFRSPCLWSVYVFVCVFIGLSFVFIFVVDASSFSLSLYIWCMVFCVFVVASDAGLGRSVKGGCVQRYLSGGKGFYGDVNLKWNCLLICQVVDGAICDGVIEMRCW